MGKHRNIFDFGGTEEIIGDTRRRPVTHSTPIDQNFRKRCKKKLAKL